MRFPTLTAAAACGLVLLASACSSGAGGSSGANGTNGSFTPPKIAMAAALGQNEGQVNMVVWAGYAEDGSDDKTVDWVHPFEQQTGCKVNAKVAGTSDEMVSLMDTGQYDLVSASGDATLRLIASGAVAPVNTSLVPNYADIMPGLKNKPWNSVGGQMYGIPHGRGANLLMYRTDKVNPAPDSWSAVFDNASAQAGHVTAYDSPIYIADAALYLMKTKPALGITNPYELTKDQLDAAVTLLKDQHKYVGEYWSDYQKSENSFKTGDSTVGTTWQVIANMAQADKAPVAAILPKEGATGWSDTWMVSAKAHHPNCAYQWMNWIVSPKVNAQVAEWFGEAPSNAKACAQTSDKTFCDTFHATDDAYWNNVYYWTTPIRYCGDSRGANCADYAQWTAAWTGIKG
jgi:putative spermidine/putrescine transport system substrate-binding protein